MGKGRVSIGVLGAIACSMGVALDFSDHRCPACGSKLMGTGSCFACVHAQRVAAAGTAIPRPLPPAPSKDALARAKALGRQVGAGKGRGR